jgi:hypothetical protein
MEITAIKKPVFEIDVPTIGKISCRTCSLREHKQVKALRSLRSVLENVTEGDVPQTLKAIEIIWARKYLAAIDDFVKDNADYLSVPTDGKDDSTEECRLKILTMPEKLAADYTGLNFAELLDLDIIDFDLIVADAYKHMIMANKPDAVKYLNGCYAYMHDLFTADRNCTADTITII